MVATPAVLRLLEEHSVDTNQLVDRHESCRMPPLDAASIVGPIFLTHVYPDSIYIMLGAE